MTYTIGDDVLSQGSSVALGNVVYHFGYDGHGSTRLLTDDNGDIQASYAYDAYGNADGFTASTAATKYLYAGEQYDKNLGWYYLRRRYYDSASSRFNRPDPFAGDPFAPQSLHKYAYAQNNPVMYSDPSGMMEFSISGLLNTFSIQNIIRTIRTAGLVKTLQWATNIIVGGVVAFDWYQGIQAGATLDAFTIGIGGSWRIPRLPVGVAGALDVVIGRHTHNWVVYGAGGGTTNNSISYAGYVGLAFNTPSSRRYRGIGRSVTFSVSLLPERIRKFIRDKIQESLPKLLAAFMARRGELGDLARSIDPQIVAKTSQVITSALSRVFGDDSSITLWGGGFTAFGLTFNPGIVSGGTSAMVSSSVMYYQQLLPWGTDIRF